MTNQELIAKYNPANARNLSNEDLAAMRQLTTDQIKVLAEAFPNGPRNRAYLVLHDTKIEDDRRQIGQLSTWQNLYNVRKFSNMKNLVPASFREVYTRTPARAVTASVSNHAGALRNVSARKVIDLSAQEAANELRANAAAASTMTAGKPSAEPAAEVTNTGTVIAPPSELNDINKQQATKTAKASTAKPTTAASKRAAGSTTMKAATAKADAPVANVPADQDFGDGGTNDVTDTNVGDPGEGNQQGG